MPLYLALSCLQTRPMEAAFNELTSLGPDGIQLTPGCVPTPAFEAHVESSSFPYSLHHGFSWAAYKQPVWALDDLGIDLLVPDGRSIHPPKSSERPYDEFLEAALWYNDKAVYETMYPGYHLGNEQQLLTAVNYRLPLAVDVSHLYIQLHAGVLSAAGVQRLVEYDNIKEIHLSHNSGKSDSHKPINQDTYLLPWVKERLSAGALVVLESYFHKLSVDDRRQQLELVRT